MLYFSKIRIIFITLISLLFIIFALSNLFNFDNKIYKDVSEVKGFAMLLNKKKMKGELFDENFFLYLENTDLCLRMKKKNQNIYIIKNSIINHLGESSIVSKDLEYLRNWHWMWSKFYFNKKHYGYLNALSKVILNLLSGMLKYILYSILFNSHKKKIYLMRVCGLYNSILGKKSWYRIND